MFLRGDNMGVAMSVPCTIAEPVGAEFCFSTALLTFNSRLPYDLPSEYSYSVQLSCSDYKMQGVVRRHFWVRKPASLTVNKPRAKYTGD